ncbi:MAG: hypothetical protein AAF772_00525 [Acidobacteriota bacterium]
MTYDEIVTAARQLPQSQKLRLASEMIDDLEGPSAATSARDEIDQMLSSILQRVEAKAKLIKLREEKG